MDIVERLAADAAYTVSELAAVGIDIQATETTVGEAAATITALRARVEELERVGRETSEYLRKLEANMLENDADMLLLRGNE